MPRAVRLSRPAEPFATRMIDAPNRRRRRVRRPTTHPAPWRRDQYTIKQPRIAWQSVSLTAGTQQAASLHRRRRRRRRLHHQSPSNRETMATNGPRATPPSRFTRKQKELDHEEKLKLLDDELMSFYQYCQQVGFSEAEMDVICVPLVSALRRNYMRKVLKIVGVLMVAAAFVYGLTQITMVTVHLTAVGRLLMIKMLPFWDWTSMFYESCLVTNPFYGEYTITEDDCVSCEALESVDRLSNVGYDHLLDGYLHRHAPLIVADAMEAWSVMNTDDFWFDNITQVYSKDDKLADTVPCILTTNLRPGSSDLHSFLKRIQNPKVDKWFVHWQNCDIHAVKALRKFYQRPYFLSSSVSPAHFNWVLMSSDYNTKIYKKVELDSGLIMLAQLRGSTSLKLTPHNPCNSSCPELRAELHEGEMLVFTNFLWTFEYLPGRDLDNVAILTETVWEENAS